MARIFCIGDAGADTLFGGNDAFYDRLIGGADADTFVMDNQGGTAAGIYDQIDDFDGTVDRIDLSGTSATSVADFTENVTINGGAMVGTADGTRFFIIGVTAADVTANPGWFIF